MSSAADPLDEGTQTRVIRRHVPEAPVDHRIEPLLEDLTRRWEAGERPFVEEILAAHPELAGDPDQVLRLICEEICLRQEHDGHIARSDLMTRFPEYRDRLQVLLGCHQLFLSEPDADDLPEVGDTLAGFHLLSELGRGGHGRVFLATQQALSDRPVVVKVVPPETAEHLCVARLQHTHIVPLYSTHRTSDGDWLLLCMPYFGSQTLDRFLTELQSIPLHSRTGRHLVEILDREGVGQFPVARESPARKFLSRISYVSAICWIGACLADALQFAHDQELLHLDIKPSNVLLTTEGQPMLLDFHLAQPPLQPGEASRAWLGGTRGYMPPEQRQALDELRTGYPIAVAVDARADIYSLGVLLREALGLPTEGSSGACLPPQVSPGLLAILERCTATEPAERYPHASALAEDLRRHLNDLPLAGVANRSITERWRKWRRRNPRVLSGYLLGSLLLSAGLCGAFLGVRMPDAGSPAMPSRSTGGQQRHWAQEELHTLAEQLRRATRADRLREQEALLGSAYQAIWSQRQQILDQLGHSARIEADLLDIAILSIDLQLHNASEDEVPTIRRQAMEVLEQAEALFGPSHFLLWQRREHAQRLGWTDVAEELRERDTGLAPVGAWEHYRLGRSLLQRHQPAQARRYLAEAVAIDPTQFWFHFDYARCLYRGAQWQGAVQEFTACIALSSGADRAMCHRNRALAYTQLGQEDNARQDREQARELVVQGDFRLSDS